AGRPYRADHNYRDLPAADGRAAHYELDSILCMDGHRTRDLLQLWAQTQHIARRAFCVRHSKMGFMFVNPFRKCLKATLVVTASLGLFPVNVCAWGGNGQKVVVNQAIDTLPSDLRAYFENNRSFFV